MSRTERQFPFDADIWPMVEDWARREGYRRVAGEGECRRYRRRSLLMPARFLEIRRDKGVVHLCAWVASDAFLILALLTGKRPEMPLTSGGLTARVPRHRAREAVNRLLISLGQPLIL